MIGIPFKKGVSGNPTGRPKGVERVAADEADEWAKRRGITGPHAGVRAAMRVAFEKIDDPKIDEKDRLAYLKFAVERFAGKPRESIDLNTEPTLSDDDYASAIAEIVREGIAAMSPDERLKLLVDPAPQPTIQ